MLTTKHACVLEQLFGSNFGSLELCTGNRNLKMNLHKGYLGWVVSTVAEELSSSE